MRGPSPPSPGAGAGAISLVFKSLFGVPTGGGLNQPPPLPEAPRAAPGAGPPASARASARTTALLLATRLVLCPLACYALFAGAQAAQDDQGQQGGGASGGQPGARRPQPGQRRGLRVQLARG